MGQVTSQIRVAVGLSRAVERHAVRDSFESSDRVNLVAVSMSISTLVKLANDGEVDVVVLGDDIHRIHEGFLTIAEKLPERRLLLVGSDVAATSRTFGVTKDRVIEARTDPKKLGDAILTAVGGRRSSDPTETTRVNSELRRADDPVAKPPPPANSVSASFKRRELVVIGVSTGGPEALPVVLNSLPHNFPVPIVVVQHMPAGFTKAFAQQLDKTCPLTVRELTEPVQAQKGEVWLAPGDRHVMVSKVGPQLTLDDGPPENNCRPAVDVLFRTAAATYGRRTVAIILTGMGDDGCRGAKPLKDQGAHIIAQDEQTSVVWGMAGAVTRAGLTDAVVPLEQIADELCGQFTSSIKAVRS